MNLHLIVPDLLGPARDPQEPRAQADAPALEMIAARGRRSRPDAVSLEAWLCARFGVPPQSDLPIAPHAFAADGGEPGSDYWLCADPSHLRVATDQLVLVDASGFEISRAEAERLVETLNAHFVEEQLTFIPMQPDRWYVRLPEPAEITTTPLPEARGRSIDPLLPRGPASRTWHARLNELQMLLHDHPVNTARETRGAMPINSVWLWGGGTFAAPATRPFARVRADLPLAVGLARSSGAAVFPCPPNAAACLAGIELAGVEAVVLDALRTPAAYGDFGAWREGLARLERDWFAPLLAALKHGRIGMLTLHVMGAGGALHIETTRQDLRYFWRRPRPMPAWQA